MTRIVYVGIDDTDNLESVGTGRVARGLGKRFEQLNLGTSLGVTRHQLLVHPEIRYTSHNSCKGLALKTSASVEDLTNAAEAYMNTCFQPGSDPGLCVCEEEQVTSELNDFGLNAEKVVLTKSQAFDLAQKLQIVLKELGGDGGGIIGALAAVGLRSTGNNGRLVEAAGVRDIKGVISVGELIAKTAIVAVQDLDGNNLDPDELIDSLDWIRPTLTNWEAVLRVVRADNLRDGAIWAPAEKAFRPTGGQKND